jgi:hypothetical protein
MTKPPVGQYSLSAVVGAIVGSIGGLFAIGLVRAILGRNLALLFSTPILGLMSWVVCGAVGWVLGGQIGPRCAEKFDSPQAELIGAGIGGLVPVLLVILWAWHMTPH